MGKVKGKSRWLLISAVLVLGMCLAGSGTLWGGAADQILFAAAAPPVARPSWRRQRRQHRLPHPQHTGMRAHDGGDGHGRKREKAEGGQRGGRI